MAPSPVLDDWRLVAAAAGARLAGVVGRFEAVAAAAGGDGVGVVDGEAGAHQAGYVVHLAAGDVARAHLVPQDPSTLQLERHAPSLGLASRHAILHAGASPARATDARAQRR